MKKCFDIIISYSNLKSTNDFIINQHKFFLNPKNIIVLTHNQINGRGSYGKKWFSDENSLTFSFSYKSQNFKLSREILMLTANSILNYLKTVNICAHIKYPNDIFVGGKKIAGILVERISSPIGNFIVSGVGLNLNNKSFPNYLTNPVSVYQINNKKLNKENVLIDLINEITNSIELNENDKPNIKDNFLNHLHGFNNYVPCSLNGRSHKIMLKDVLDNGTILIKIKGDNKLLKIDTKDIRFLLD